MWRLDPLSRNLGDLILLAERFGTAGVALHSFTERLDLSSATGRMFYNVLGSFAQFYREQLAENVSMGMARAAREGKWTNRPKTGCDLIDGELVPNDQADTVRRIFELRAAGHSYTEIERLTGVKYSTVHGILDSRIYLGEVVYAGEWFKGHHDPIITAELFARAHRGWVPGKKRLSRHPLSGIVRCGLCGRAAAATSTGKGGWFYRCWHRGQGCRQPVRSVHGIERAALLGLRLVGFDDEVQAAIRRELRQGAPPGAPYRPAPPERPYAEEVGVPPGKLRIAFTRSALLDERPMDPECVAAVEEAARLCAELGHEVAEARPPLDIPALVDTFITLSGAEGAFQIAESERLTGRRARFGDVEPVTWIIRLIGDKRSAADLDRAFGVMRRTAQAVAAFMESYDLILTATMAQPPWHIGDLDLSVPERALLRFVRRFPARPILASVVRQLAGEILRPMPNTPLCNLTGQPAMSVPLHWTPAGLPVGVQFIGRLEEEGLLFRLAAQLEAARPWWDRRPALAG